MWPVDHYHPLVGVLHFISCDKFAIFAWTSVCVGEGGFQLNYCWPCQLHYLAVRSPCQRTSRWWGCPESGMRWLQTEPRRGSPPQAPGPAPRSTHSPSPDHLWHRSRRTLGAQTDKLLVFFLICVSCLQFFLTANMHCSKLLQFKKSSGIQWNKKICWGSNDISLSGPILLPSITNQGRRYLEQIYICQNFE